MRLPISAMSISGSIVVADGPTRGANGLIDVTGQVRSVRLDVLSPTERRRLVTSSGEPMILWLNEAGRPMTSPAWAAVFRRASMRCRAFGIDLDVTPHALRHYLPCLTMSSNADRDLRLLKNARIAAHQFTQSPDIVS